METTKNEQELNITNISEAETNINNLNNTSKKYVIDMKEKKDDDDKRIPDIREESKMRLEKINKEQHFTEPPPRFNEASLIMRLEEEGIGRPSTYASIISKIQERNYVKKEKNRLVPEDTGRLLNFFLEAYFNKYIEYNYTAKLEENLDEISSGEKHWKDVIKGFWEELSQSVEYAMSFSITEVLDNLNIKLADYLFNDGTGKYIKTAPHAMMVSLG